MAQPEMHNDEHSTLEAFHERIQSSADEREDIQKKTFTKWINSHLTKNDKAEVQNLFKDFCDGKSLLALLEILSGIPLQPEKGRMRVHHLNNVNRAVQFLTDKCNIKLVNISSDDVVNGNAKLILGLVWSIILHWQVKRAMALSSEGVSQEGFEKTLLSWCRSSTAGYKNVNIQNFTSSWSDGFAFNALIHSHRPDLLDYDELVAINDKDYTLLHAFHIANSGLEIAKLLDPEDMVRPDKKSVLVYLTCLYEVLHTKESPRSTTEGDTSPNQNNSSIPTTNQKEDAVQSPNQAANQNATSNFATNQLTSPNESTNQNSAVARDNLNDTITTSTSPTSSDLPVTSTPQKIKYGVESDQVPETPTKVPRLNNALLLDQSVASVPLDTESDITTITTASGVSSLTDLTTFNSLLETTLIWLQDAKDKFNKMKPVAEEVDVVKDQFHEHEKYMMELTQYQGNVGSLLNKGNTLLMAGDLNDEQEQEVRNLVELLNQEWEELRVGAMERQTSLQQSLMDLQLDQLNELSSWLTEIESKIENFNSKVENIETLEGVKKCVEEHKKLQDSLERQQDRVNSLQNMVVIVEDGVQDPVVTNKSAYQSMERMLEELGTRWAAVCQWIDDKWQHLQDVDVKWRHYHGNADFFNKWLDEKEVLLGRMQLSDISDPQILLNQVQRLKAIEGEMDDQMGRYDELNMVGQALISYLPSFPKTTEKIQHKLEEYKQRWDRLVEGMYQQSKLIAESGINPQSIIEAAGRHQRAVLEEHEALAASVTAWLQKADKALTSLESEPTLEEQSKLIESLCGESSTVAGNVQTLLVFTKNHREELGEGKAESYTELRAKWKNTDDKLDEARDSAQMRLKRKEVTTELNSLREILQAYKDWVDAARSESETAQLAEHCEQCRVKSCAMKEEQGRVDDLFALRHSKCVVSDAELTTDINQLHTDWSAMLALIDERADSLSQSLNETPPRKYLDATDALIKWLSEVEEVLAEKIFVTDISTMEKNVNLYQDLQKAIAEHVSDVEYVNKTGEDLVKRSSLTSTDTSNSLQVQLSALNSRWQAVSGNIRDKLSQLAVNIEKLKHFESQVNGLTRWMSDMEHFLLVEQPVVGDTETLQAQINQSDGALADIKTLESVVGEINDSGKALVDGSEQEFGVELLKELEKMNERWAEINRISQSQNAVLKDALAKSSSLVENISALNNFLTNFDAEVSEKLCFTTKADLDTSCETVKKLEASLEGKKGQLELVQTLSSDLMEKSRQDSLPRLLNRLKHIDNKWKLVSDRLSTKQEECSNVSTRYSDFLSLVQSEEIYVSQLENKLITEDNQAVDAEDMAADMDELESLLEERDKQTSATLLELSAWFKHNETLVEETQLVQSELDSRLEAAIDKTRERVTLLDRASQKSQDTELKLSQMETWMDEVNSLFREWNDQDLLAGDLPDDHKTLLEEYAEKEAFLQSIELQIKDFRALGKTQAADRLEKKLHLIKEDYTIAQQNFLKWQRPVDFDPKLRRTQQQLHEIDDKIYLIELFSEDPEHVGIRLEHCTRFYGIMSEIKTEVEYVIKTGRQLVEKKQVDFPRRVSQTLDALKSLYNRLGERISLARKQLDKALKISKVIAKHVTKVTELVETTEARLATGIADLDGESKWVQETERDFEKVHPTLTDITNLFEQFQKYAEATALDEANENLESLKERWQAVIQALAARQRHVLAQTSNTDADFQMFTVKSKKLIARLNSLRNLLDQPEQSLKLQAELANLQGDVTELNHNADKISSVGDNYKEQITPMINSVNSAYQDLSRRAQPDLEQVSAPAIVEAQGSGIMEVDRAASVIPRLREAVTSDMDKYQLASMFARCEATESDLTEEEVTEFRTLLADWNSKRNSTVERWQNYELNWTQMSMKLTELEKKLDMAQTQTDLLAEIEAEIARRQIDINALNEQAEELTEQDTPPIDQQLLQLNQRWVGIRSSVANFKPNGTSSNQTNGTADHPANGTASIELSPPTKQKYEYAVINKNRKNQNPVTITSEIRIEPEPVKREMAIDLLSSPATPTNNNSLYVGSPSVETAPSTSKTSTPGSVDVDDESISFDEMTASTSSKRSIIVTDLDEAAKSASTDDLKPADVISSNLQQSSPPSKSLSAEGEEAMEDIRRLLSRVGILQQQLKNSGIEMDQYNHENFNSSQDLLASVRISMEVLEQNIIEASSALGNLSNTDSVHLRESLDRLNEAWNQLSTSYKTLQSNFDEALTLWTKFHTLLKVITTWLELTEKSLKRTRDRSGELIIEQAKTIQKDLEEGMSQHQAIIHNLARTAIPLASKLRPADAERITNKVSQVTARWREITVEIRGRKPRLDSSDSGKCLDVMDDLSFWLDETEIIITTSPNFTDEMSLRETLEKVKDRREEVPHKKEALEFVSRSAKDLWSLPELKPEDKEKIGRDMQRVSRKWNMIRTNIEERQRYLEESIEKLEDLLFEIGKMNMELWDAIEDLGPKMGHDNFTSIQQIFPRNQSVTIETLSIWYREVLLLYKRFSAILPENMEAHFRRLNIRWTALRERTQLNRTDSDSSIEETLATGSTATGGAAGVDDIFEEPRQSVFMDDHIPIPRAEAEHYRATVATVEEYDEDCPSPPPRRESLQPHTAANDPGSSHSSAPLNREVTLTLLRDRLAILNVTVSNKRVDVTDETQISESDAKVSKLTVAVQEILRQLSMFPEADNQVSGLRTECAECRVRSLARGKELKQLLVDSHKYGNQMAQVDSWLCQLEAKIDSQRQEAIGDAVDVIDRQIQQYQALEQEMKSWKDNYSLLSRMTEDLLTTYPNEDTSNLKLNRESLAVRYNNVQQYITEQGQTLINHKKLLEDYDKAMDDFILWITEQEAVAEILFEEVKINDPMRSSTWVMRAKDLQSQIESHQNQHELLGITGKKMAAAAGGDDSADGQVIKRRLDEMNERWTQLRAKTVQIRCRLESSMDQWSELISRCRQLIDYLTSRENELIGARPVSGSLPGLKQQLLQHEDWKMRLESKTSDFEHAISTGRFYLEREGADRRLSSASCDSRIMDELTVESSDAKTVIKNIRRHIRLLNQKWLDLHNKSDRWQNQLVASEKSLEAIDNLLNLAARHLNEIDINTQSWKNADEYPVSDLPRQLTSARGLRRRNEQVSEILTQSRAIVRTHEQTEGPINMETKQNISRIADRQQRVDKQVADRVTVLIGLNRSLVPEVSELLKDSIARPYERATTPAGVPYYINHDKKTTQWDHPRMVNLLAQLPKFNSTKFSAYRTAQKLRKMQKALGLSSIRLKDVIRSCQEHKILSPSGEEVIDINLIISCLRDLFEHLVDDRHASGVNVPLSIDLSLNWLLNVYDLGRQGQLRSLSFQVGLVIMCRGAVEDKFNYLLSCLADKAGQIDERKLSFLLSDCIQIPRQLGELSSFGGANIDPSVQSCLEQAKSTGSVNCRQFMDWLALEPQSMVWLPVYHRLATSESCRHQAKCSLCKTTPIIGLRYRCLRCFNFNLCQNCFFAGKKGKSHKLNHPMKEYYCASTSNDDMKDLSSPMRKKYSSGRYIKKHHPKGYLPLNKLADGDSTFSRESLSMMSDTGTPVSSPSSIHIQYEMGGSLSSHDGIQSHEIDTPRGEDSDMHRDIAKYTNTLDRLERQNTNNGNNSNTGISTELVSATVHSTNHRSDMTDNGVPPEVAAHKDIGDDEHVFIERYCSSLKSSPGRKTNGVHTAPNLQPEIPSASPLKSPMQIVMSLGDNHKTELEAMIKDLEDENRNLQSEYQRLQAERDQQPVLKVSAGNGDREAEMLAEAKLLRQHKGRLESRMKILEDHNKQLEAQLHRLRHLLEQPADSSGSELMMQTSTPQTSSSNSPLRAKKLPPTYERQSSEQQDAPVLMSSQRTPKLHGSIGELFQMAGQVGKAVGQLVSVVSDQPQTS